MPRRAIAVDLGGTNLRAGVVTETGEVGFHLSELTLASQGPDAVLGQIARLIAGVRAEAGDALPSIGVSAPGPLDTRRGVAVSVQTLAGFDGFPMKAELQRRLACPVALENDGVSGAIGEWRFGAGRGLQDMLYVTLSTGIGGGVIAGGRPLRGRNGLAGHVGHIFFHADWERYPGGVMTCFEDFASASALAHRAGRTAAELVAAAGAGDTAARALIEDEAQAVGLGLASLVHVLNPERIVVGGGLAAGLPDLLPRIEAAMARNLKPGFGPIGILPAALGPHSCLVGAGALALDPDLAT